MQKQDIINNVHKLLDEAIKKVESESNPQYKKDWDDLKEEFQRILSISKQQEEGWNNDNFTVLQIEEQGFRRGVDYALDYMKNLDKWRDNG